MSLTKRANAMKKILQYENLMESHSKFLQRPNHPQTSTNGIVQRYQTPVLTSAHAPLHWRYDFNYETNPLGLERIGINATFNPGAIKWNGKYVLAVRVEGADRKSFFAMAESPNGTDNFRFWDKPVVLPQTEEPDTNVYDMRLTAHEDGWIYGIFCTERKDKSNPDTTAAVANAGIARTK